MAFSLSAAQSTFSGRVTLAQPRRAAPARSTRPATVAGIFDGLFGGGAKEPPATKAAPSKASSSTSQLSYICALPAARRGFLLAYTASSGLDCGYIYKVRGEGGREELALTRCGPLLQGDLYKEQNWLTFRCPVCDVGVVSCPSPGCSTRLLARTLTPLALFARTASRRTSRREPRTHHFRLRRRRSSRRVAPLPGTRQNTAFRKAVPGSSD